MRETTTTTTATTNTTITTTSSTSKKTKYAITNKTHDDTLYDIDDIDELEDDFINENKEI